MVAVDEMRVELQQGGGGGVNWQKGFLCFRGVTGEAWVWGCNTAWGGQEVGNGGDKRGKVAPPTDGEEEGP